jgi:hypothetical protein
MTRLASLGIAGVGPSAPSDRTLKPCSHRSRVLQELDRSLKACGVVPPNDYSWRSLLVAIRPWAHQYIRDRFGHSRIRDIFDLAEDAAQHLVLSIASGKAPTLSSDGAVAWCRVVLANFVVSELRKQSGRDVLGTRKVEQASSAEEMFQRREEFACFVEELRRQIRHGGHGNTSARLALFDDFIRDILGASRDRLRPASNRDHQRRSRGRRVAEQAWNNLKARPEARLDFIQLARLLGFDQDS